MSREKALELFKGPFRYDAKSGHVYDAEGKRVVYIPLSGFTPRHEAEEQDIAGEFVAAALTNEFNKLKKEDA